jgi:hypothetical protein
MTGAPTIQIKAPELIQGNETLKKLYREAFDSVFKLIKSTGKLDGKSPDDVTKIGEAVNNHAQAVFLAKMGIDNIDLKTSSINLQEKLGLKGNAQNAKEYQPIISEFQKSADKIESFKSIIQDFDYDLIGRYNQAKDQKSTSALLQVTAKLIENIPEEGETKLDSQDALKTHLERKEKISNVIFSAVAEVQSIMKLNPKADAGAWLTAAIGPGLEKQGITSLTKQEKASILDVLNNKLGTKEQAEVSTNKLQEFIKNNGQWLMMLFPVVAGPLAKVFSYIPILGQPLNALLSQVQQNSGMLLTLLASNALGNKSSNTSSEPVSPKIAPPAKAEADPAQASALAA